MLVIYMYNHWTELVDWTGGVDWWSGLVDSAKISIFASTWLGYAMLKPSVLDLEPSRGYLPHL